MKENDFTEEAETQGESHENNDSKIPSMPVWSAQDGHKYLEFKEREPEVLRYLWTKDYSKI